jgi:hypothetical protein
LTYNKYNAPDGMLYKALVRHMRAIACLRAVYISQRVAVVLQALVLTRINNSIVHADITTTIVSRLK